MSVTSALARETPVTAKMIATGNWNALKSPTPVRSAMSPSAPTFTTKKKTGIMRAGIIASGSRGIWRSARVATDTKSLKKPACEAVTSAERVPGAPFQRPALEMSVIGPPLQPPRKRARSGHLPGRRFAPRWRRERRRRGSGFRRDRSRTCNPSPALFNARADRADRGGTVLYRGGDF